jgi:hypothetical protein
MSITCGDMKKLSILYPQDRKEKVKKKKNPAEGYKFRNQSQLQLFHS